MKSPNKRHAAWPLILGIIGGILALTSGPALAALTFGGASISGNGAISIDSSSTISIGTSTATGVTIGNRNATTSFLGPISISTTVFGGVLGTTAIGTITYTGSGINDLVITGTYSCSQPGNEFDIYIDSTGAPDTFGALDTAVEIDNVPITGGAQPLFCGLSVQFTHTTGHASDDVWVFTPTPSGVQAPIVVNNYANGLPSLTVNYDGSLVSPSIDTRGVNGDVGVGYGALANDVISQDNTITGNNTAVGAGAMFSNTTGHHNSAFGTQALVDDTTGSYNSAFGETALFYTTTGIRNTAYGDGASQGTVTGSGNTVVGATALYNNPDGNYNTAVGDNTLANNNGSGNVAIGYNAGAQGNGSDKLYIDNSSTTSPLIGGDFLARTLIFSGTPQIATLTYSGLTTCNSSSEGSMRPLTNSATSTLGAVISGSGSSHVLAYCDGTNWTVMAK